MLPDSSASFPRKLGVTDMPLHLERDDIARFYADAWRRAEEQARQEVSEALARRRVGLASMSGRTGTL
jgi:hypothetical protein